MGGADPGSAPEGELPVVEVVCGEVDVPLLGELFAGAGMPVFSYTDLETGIGTTYLVCGDGAGCAARLREVEGLLGLWRELFQGTAPVASCGVLKEEDWSRSWRKHFHGFRATRRLVIKPSWEDYAARPGDVVLELDPGMCFGTGYHGTTRACLQYLDELRDVAGGSGPVSFLDAGCGSGILSLAAVRLGYSPVAALDFDPRCVATTRENLRNAGILDVAVREGDVKTFAPPRGFRVVAANLLAPILLEAAGNLAASVDRTGGDGYLILSGILAEQYPAVRERFAALGLRETDRRTIQDWTTGCFLAPQASPRDEERP